MSMNVTVVSPSKRSLFTGKNESRGIEIVLCYLNGSGSGFLVIVAVFHSVIIKEYFSTLGEETQPSLRGATFDVLDSSMLYLSDFVYDADSSLEENANKIVLCVQKPIKKRQ